MASADKNESPIVEGLRFEGRQNGLVKTLRGFRKGQHTVPDAVTPATTAFLGKLCAEELAEDAEALFQSARREMGYKRKDLSLSLGSGQATLNAKDFSLEISYRLAPEDPSSYESCWSLSGFQETAFLRGDACSALFADRFDSLVFSLKKGAPVEAVIDAIEALEEHPLQVDYPSDCSHCILSVEGVDAQVRFDGAELSMIFTRRAAPVYLLDGFLAVREAFALTKARTLAGLFK